MNEISRKREAVKSAYPGESWSSRVNKMTEDQLVVVYLRLKNANKLKL